MVSIKTNIHLWSRLAEFILERQMSEKKSCRGKQNTYIIFNNT